MIPLICVRERNVGVARELIERSELHKDSAFLLALEGALQVLPTPRMISGKGVLAGDAQKLLDFLQANEAK